MDLVENAAIHVSQRFQHSQHFSTFTACSFLYVYVVNRRQRRKNRIVKKLMIGDNRRKSIVEIWRWNQTRNDS